MRVLADGERVTLTPELAREWLARTNPSFIPALYEPLLVARYAEAMRGHRWRPGSFIAMTAAGELVDGFHRCAAVVLGGASIEVTIERREVLLS